MYNDFSKEELEVILWLSNNPITTNKNIKQHLESIRNKITQEIYPNEKFIKYITNKDKDIVSIYKNKTSAKYEIIVEKLSTKKVYNVVKLIQKYFEMNIEDNFDYMIFGIDEFSNYYSHDLVYKREDKNNELEL